jgi:hypothetical protein
MLDINPRRRDWMIDRSSGKQLLHSAHLRMDHGSSCHHVRSGFFYHCDSNNVDDDSSDEASIGE